MLKADRWCLPGDNTSVHLCFLCHFPVPGWTGFTLEQLQWLGTSAASVSITQIHIQENKESKTKPETAVLTQMSLKDLIKQNAEHF